MNIGRISAPSIWSTREIIMNHLSSSSAGSDKYGFVWWMSFRTSFTCFQHEDELDLGKRKRRRGQGWVALIISATRDVWRACDLSNNCFGNLKVSFRKKKKKSDNKLYQLPVTDIKYYLYALKKKKSDSFSYICLNTNCHVGTWGVFLLWSPPLKAEVQQFFSRWFYHNLHTDQWPNKSPVTWNHSTGQLDTGGIYSTTAYMVKKVNFLNTKSTKLNT